MHRRGHRRHAGDADLPDAAPDAHRRRCTAGLHRPNRSVRPRHPPVPLRHGPRPQPREAQTHPQPPRPPLQGPPAPGGVRPAHVGRATACPTYAANSWSLGARPARPDLRAPSFPGVGRARRARPARPAALRSPPLGPPPLRPLPPRLLPPLAGTARAALAPPATDPPPPADLHRSRPRRCGRPRPAPTRGRARTDRRGNRRARRPRAPMSAVALWRRPGRCDRAPPPGAHTGPGCSSSGRPCWAAHCWSP